MNYDSKKDRIKAYFDLPESRNSYLEKRFGLEIRAYIVNKLIGEVSGKKILDLGCGDGTISLQFVTKKNQITFIDLSKKMIDLARKNTPQKFLDRCKYLNLDFYEYFPDQPFDIVLCIGVLAHLDDLEKTIENISRFLKSGGLCVVQFTDHQSLIAKINAFFRKLQKNFYQYSLQRFSYSEIIDIFGSKGFRLINDCRYSLLVPGLGRLSDKFLYFYQLYTLESKCLSKFGSEVVLLLQKND